MCGKPINMNLSLRVESLFDVPMNTVSLVLLDVAP